MSTFSCPVVPVRITPHQNADAIEIAEVGLFQSIVKKGQYQTGDLVVYIPENSLIPDPILKAMDMWDTDRDKGRCGGSGGNRVKPIKLRGVVSQGLICPLSVVREHGSQTDIVEGDDVSTLLGIVKYEQAIPAAFRGHSAGVLEGMTPKFDVENLKSNPWVFEEGENIRITEKVHGTCCIIGVFPEGYLAERGKGEVTERLYKGRIYVGSKGLTRRGIVFNPNVDTSVYTTVTKEGLILDRILSTLECLGGFGYEIFEGPFAVLGEIFGPGVQDLHYGRSKHTFAGFDIWYEDPVKKTWVPVPNKQLAELFVMMGISQVPILYEGPYQGMDHLKSFVDGKSLYFDPYYKPSPGAKGSQHTREGFVVRGDGNGKLYKMISNNYLFRKGEQTEFE